MGVGAREALGREAQQFRQELYAQFKGRLSWEDVEDVVQSALADKVGDEPDDRSPGRRADWFRAVLRNAAIDFLRARDGRVSPRRSETRQYRRGRAACVDLDLVAQAGHPALVSHEPGYDAEHLDREHDRRHAHDVAWRALNRLRPQDRRLIEMRHFHRMTNREMAAALGISLKWLEKRWSQAWMRFVRAVASDERDAHCKQARTLIRQRPTGTRTTTDGARIDAHLAGCPPCRAFGLLADRWELSPAERSVATSPQIPAPTSAPRRASNEMSHRRLKAATAAALAAGRDIQSCPRSPRGR